MRRTLLLMLLLVTLCCRCMAQSRLQGRVTDAEGKALPSVVVKVYARQGSGMSAYVLTRRDGAYSVELKSEWFPADVTFSHLGFRLKKVTLKDAPAARLDISMDEEAVKIKEVTVRNVPVRSHGDTIVYNMAAFRSASDRNVEDVIKKMPGISVDKSGQISYQGEAINKFYIEGLDLLSGRYALATRNISPDDIASVSVYENHQPRRVLKDIVHTGKAALNLKLKNSRMLKPTGTLTAGGGAGRNALWRGELFGMLIGSKVQHLVTAKGNNSGQTYAGETAALASEGYIKDDTEAWSIFPQNPFGTAAVPQERYYRNRSSTSSVNTLLKSGRDFTLTVNGDYTYDRNEADNSKTTEYVSADGGSVIITEDNGQHTARHTANMTLKAEKNSDKLYLKETLSVRGRFLRNRYSLGYADPVVQRQHTDDIRIKNTLSTVIRRKGRIWQFDSNISYSSTPGNNIAARIPSADSTVLVQRVEGRSLRTAESTSFRWLLGSRSDVSVALSFESAYDELESSLLKYGGGADNDNRGYSLLTTVRPAYQYRGERLRLTVEVPLMMRDISYKDIVNDTRFTMDRPYVGLRSVLRYALRSNLSTSLTVGCANTTGGLTDFVTNPVFTTYRTQTTLGTGRLNMSTSYSVMTNTDYRNTLGGLFLTLRGMFRRSYSDIMRSSTVSTSSTASEAVSRRNFTDTWNVYAYAAKTFGSPDITLSLTGNFVSASRRLMRQGFECRVGNTIADAVIAATGSFLDDRLTAALDCRYAYMSQRLSPGGTENTQHEGGGTLKVSVFPVRKVEFYVRSALECSGLSGGDSFTSLFLDGGARLTVKSVEAELSLTNLTNRRRYTKRTIVENDIYTYSYSLRPAECLLTVKFKL